MELTLRDDARLLFNTAAKHGISAADLVSEIVEEWASRGQYGRLRPRAESKPDLTTTLREAMLALVDVMPYLHPNPNSPRAQVWGEWKEAALDKAAAALEAADTEQS